MWIADSYATAKKVNEVFISWNNRDHETDGLGPVHTNPFSNENGAVLLRFQKDLRSHLSFSYRFRPSTLERRSREKPHGSVCPPFWILTVEWSGAQTCLFRWRHRFQITSFPPFTLEDSVFKKLRFQIAPLWRAFPNGSVFGDRSRLWWRMLNLKSC